MSKRKLLKGFDFTETFTSLKARTIVSIVRFLYDYPERGGRILKTRGQTISLQRGVEFDVAKEFGLYEDSEIKKDYNPSLRKLYTVGTLINGKGDQKIDPNEVYKLLMERVASEDGSIFWRNRPLKPEVAELLKLNSELEKKLEDSETKIQELRNQLAKNGLK